MTLPKMVVKKHDGVYVLRDDLCGYGSKARFLDPLFARIKERQVIYGSSPRWGYAQISIAYLAREYGKRATLFIAKGKLLPYTLRAMGLGAKVVEVGTGFLAVCEAAARRYAEDVDGCLLPCGLDTPEVVQDIARQARTLSIEPDEVWTVASSGTLTRGLQTAYPDADFFAVQVGKELKKQAGRATIIGCGLPFSRPAKVLPPFPSVPEYDAKAWQYIPKDGKKVRLFWNVGG